MALRHCVKHSVSRATGILLRYAGGAGQSTKIPQ